MLAHCAALQGSRAQLSWNLLAVSSMRGYQLKCIAKQQRAKHSAGESNLSVLTPHGCHTHTTLQTIVYSYSLSPQLSNIAAINCRNLRLTHARGFQTEPHGRQRTLHAG